MASNSTSTTTDIGPISWSWGLGWAILFFGLLLTASWTQTSKLAVAFAYLVLLAVIFDTYSHSSFIQDLTNVWGGFTSGNISQITTPKNTTTSPTVGSTTPSGTTNVSGRTTNP